MLAAKNADVRLQALYSRLEQIRTRIEGTAHTYDETGVKSNSGAQRDKIGEYLVMKEQLLEEIDRLEDVRLDAMKVIMSVPDPEEQQILEDYYLAGLPCKDIGKRLGYSKQTIYRKKDQAERKADLYRKS